MKGLGFPTSSDGGHGLADGCLLLLLTRRVDGVRSVLAGSFFFVQRVMRRVCYVRFWQRERPVDLL